MADTAVKIKICGLMRVEDVQTCRQLGVDMLGFVVDYPLPVPWSLNRAEAKALMEQAAPCQTCIVTGGPEEQVIALAKALKPDFIQLHYRETLADTVAIVQALAPLGVGVIKTLPLTEDEQIHQLGTTDVEEIVAVLCGSGISAILVDTRSPENAHRPGMVLDTAMARLVQEQSTVPVIIAGGIIGNNVRELLSQTGATFIDVMTGVEDRPGVKNRNKIAHIIEQAHL